jgi:hypothetical protein
MRDPLDLFIVAGCAVCAISLARATVVEARTGKPTAWFMLVASERDNSPKLFMYRQVILWMATALCVFFAVTIGAVWLGLI